MRPPLRRLRTPTLEIAYEESGPETGEPVILLHGFPYDVRAYDGVVAEMAGSGCRLIVPYLRGYGETRILDDRAMRSGQQAALGRDLLDFMDAQSIARATLVGYDWGGRAACIVAALWPERVRALITGEGYNIQSIARSGEPAAADVEHRYWYQYYFHSERGRLGLERNRRDICRLIWRLWSPNWAFSDQEFETTAKSFDNSDFVEVVIHSYRHRFGYAPGDPGLEPLERTLAAQPKITVPAMILHGEADGVHPPGPSANGAEQFAATCERRIVPTAGP